VQSAHSKSVELLCRSGSPICDSSELVSGDIFSIKDAEGLLE
jgi:hypothetical protein